MLVSDIFQYFEIHNNDKVIYPLLRIYFVLFDIIHNNKMIIIT